MAKTVAKRRGRKPGTKNVTNVARTATATNTTVTFTVEEFIGAVKFANLTTKNAVQVTI